MAPAAAKTDESHSVAPVAAKTQATAQRFMAFMAVGAFAFLVCMGSGFLEAAGFLVMTFMTS